MKLHFHKKNVTYQKDKMTLPKFLCWSRIQIIIKYTDGVSKYRCAILIRCS